MLPILMAIVLWALLGSLSLITVVVKTPFDYFKNFVYNHPLETTRTVVGCLTSALIAYLFDLPYTFEITIGGGIALFVLGEFS